MSRLVLIANTAASGFTGAKHRRVKAILSRTFDIDVLWPTDPDQATILAKQAALDGAAVVAGMGGDGVVNRIATGLVGSETALAVIPAGTTNVLARILGLPNDAIGAAEYLAANPTARPLSLIGVDPGEGPNRVGTFAVGFGLDADVVDHAERASHRKRSMGGLHYGQTAVRLFLTDFRRRRPTMTVRYEDEEVRAVGVMIQLHDPYTYFGSMPLRVAPQPTEGLDILVIERISVRRLPKVLINAVRGGDLSAGPNLRIASALEKVELEADDQAGGQGDGELFGSVSGATVRLMRHALLSCYPESGST